MFSVGSEEFDMRVKGLIATLPLHEKLNVRCIIASKNQFLKIGIRTLAKSLTFLKVIVICETI